MKKIKGNRLMIFLYGDGGASGSALAFATNHTLNISTSTENITSKQSGGLFENKIIKSVSWQITSENLYAETDDGHNEVSTLYSHMLSGKPFYVVFSQPVSNAETIEEAGHAWEASEQSYWVGKCLVTNLQLNAPSGDKATYSVTLDGVGELSNIIQED